MPLRRNASGKRFHRLATTAIAISVFSFVIQDAVPASASSIRMIWPTSGTITSRYDYRCSGAAHSGHGYDIGASTGTSVVAALDGKIITKETWTTSYGWHIVIQHSAGYQTLYAHLSAFASGVSIGSSVVRGQAIGSVGATGNASGAHLHFFISPNGNLDSLVSCGDPVTRGNVIPFDFPAGLDTIGVARPSVTTGAFDWYLRNSNSAGSTSYTPFAFGRKDTNDAVVVGDWNGDGIETVGAVKRNTDGTWSWNLRNSNSAGGPSIAAFPFGRWSTNDVPATGDWNADTVDTIGAVKKQATGAWQWNLRNSNSAGGPSYAAFEYGNANLGDVPVTGDWNGA